MAGIGGKKLSFVTTAAMLGLAMFPAIGAELSFEILAKNITDDAIVVETKPGDVLVFNGGVHTLDGRRLIVIADRIELRGTTLIRSFDPADTPPPVAGQAGTGATGANGSKVGCGKPVCPLQGQSGGRGETGATGRNGRSAGSILFTYRSIGGSGRIVVIGNGQTGGRGQKGGRGGEGGKGLAGENRGGDGLCFGQANRLDGERGGDGGPGGRGGAGGRGGGAASMLIRTTGLNQHVRLAPPDAIEMLKPGRPDKLTGSGPSIYFGNTGGTGGAGGAGGDGGPPGVGGPGGGNSHCGGGGQPGLHGDTGPRGPSGQAGAGGNGNALAELTP